MLESTLAIVLAVLAAFLISLFVYFKWSFSYWKRKGLPCVKPLTIFGNVSDVLRQTKLIGEFGADCYNYFRSRKLKHGGVYCFTKPVYMPIDPELIKKILCTDFVHFESHGVYYNETADPMTANLVFISGTKWRNRRAKLTSAFSSGKMKMMFPVFLQCGLQLKEAMEVLCAKEEAVNIQKVMGLYTMDVIGSSAFGLECNSFKNPNSDFMHYAEQALTIDLPKLLHYIFLLIFPRLGRLFNVAAIPKNISSFFIGVITKAVGYREKNNFVRNDFLQILIDLKNKDSSEEKMSMEEIFGNCFIFFLGGYETSAAVLNFCMYELALNQHMQDEVRNEIKAVLKKYDDQITYEAIGEMNYLKTVIDESLRKYPSISYSPRMCTKTYKVPDTNVVIDEGTFVVIPVLGLHYDPEYYPDPEKFDPERFTEENKRSRPPFTYLPFSEGPRNCIGMRFGLTQVKVGVTILIQNYKFFVNSKTSTPLIFEPRSIMTAVKDGIWLDVQKV